MIQGTSSQLGSKAKTGVSEMGVMALFKSPTLGLNFVLKKKIP